MNKDSSRNIRLGIFVVTGVVLLVLGLYFIGSNKNIFGSTITLYAKFTNVAGLQEGNNVRYAGIDVGTVNKIEIVNDTTIRVSLTIEDKLKNVIRKNSIASVGTDGLMGNRLININPGDPDAGLVSEGDTLYSVGAVNTEQMLRTLQITNENMSIISVNLKNITNNIGRSRGTLYKLLLDTTLAERFYNTINNVESVSENLHDITVDLSDVSGDMKQGKGIMGTLLKDTLLASDFKEAVRLVKESGEKLNSSTADLKSILQKMNRGEGTAGVLLNDTTTANQLKRSIINIENSTRNFNENMEGLKHSFLLRGYFKKQAKKNNP
jgi:phospholipid/cholesterol/gamma-HCH transport system substrate-binding protein